MLAVERHAAILAELQSKPAVKVVELAGLFSVSEMTIRRDIESLVAAGALHKVHGGATRSPALSAVEPGFRSNVDRQSTSKRAIAQTAASLVAPGMTVAVTGGSTTFQLTDYLAGIGALTVLTNSLPVAERIFQLQAAGGGRELKVLLTGGERTPSEALVGPLATTAIRGLNADICFMGVHGVDVNSGITTPNLAEADTNRAFAQQCARLVVLADSTKFGVVSLARIAELSQLGTLITDRDAPEEYSRHTHLIIAGQPSGKDPLP